MSPVSTLILIKDEIKTEDVSSLSFDDASHTCVVVFNSGKSYRYNAGNVVCLENPVPHDFSEQKICADGSELHDIQSVLEFKNPTTGKRYWHVIFKTGAKTYRYDDLKVLNMSKDEFSNSVLNYLKDIAANNPLLIPGETASTDRQKDVSILQRQYEKIKGIYEHEETALTYYLKTGPLKDTHPMASKDLIFPFGSNLSQINAVQNTFKYNISLIQGPPGTGKTQTILNILANLLIQGKTALVVSNNNSAIQNVQEKLAQYKLDFLSAMLGKSENKEAFVQSQVNRKIDLPTVQNDPTLQLWKMVIPNYVAAAKTLFSTQNELAQVKAEYEGIQKNYEHFKVYLKELGVSNDTFENRNNLEQGEIKEIRDQIEAIAKKKPSKNQLSFFMRFKIRFFKGLFNWNFLKGNIAAIIASLEDSCYVAQLAEYANRIRSLTNTVKANEKASANLVEFSKGVLYDNLSKRFNSQKQTVYSKDDLYFKWSLFLKDYPIVFSTTFASKSALNHNAIFDYIIMDESSQVDIATGALALSCAKNAVIVGDSKQLDKVTTKSEKEKYDEIFAKHKVPQMYNCGDVTFLNSIAGFIPAGSQTLLREHYRCNPKIIEFCNQKFYDNQLIVLSKNSEQNPLKIHWTVPASQENNVNQKQVDAIAREVLPQLTTHDVGIIAPYRNQCRALRNVIPGLDISTIHKFQGREKDAIIFSTVDNELTEFSGDPQIINVAVSRAKNQFILVATKQEQPKGSLLSDLIGYIQYNAGISTESAIYSIFDFLFDSKKVKSFDASKQISKYPTENAAYEMICRVLKDCPSLEVYFEYPMNHLIRDFSKLDGEPALLHYAKHPATHIDFLITNRITKSPVLAVEIDGASFHKADSVQGTRDRMKNAILERYGIDYIRFSTKGNGEEEKLREKVKGFRI